MEAAGLYLLRSAVWITGFALVYLLFLRNERFFLLNRIYLVTGIIASVILPLVTIRYVVEVPVIQAVAKAGPVTSALHDGASGQPDLAVLLLAVWLAGVVIILTRFVVQVLPVLRAAAKAEQAPGYPVRVIRSSAFPGSFSLFSLVIVNPSVSETETREIMNHELVHIRQMHWFDLVLSSLLCAVQWFNPAAWIYSSLIRQNHEYLADEEALQRSSDPAVYKAVLLNQIAGSPVIDLGNFFSNSLNKKRFTMMKNTFRSPFRKLKLLLILPVAALVLYAFAKPEYRVVSDPAETAPVATVAADLAKSVTGTVKDDAGKPLEGAVLVIKGTTIGTVSDASGRFSLKDVPDDAVLLVSYVGFTTKAIKVSAAGSSIDVLLQKSTVVTDTVTVGSVPPPPPPPPPPIPENVLVVLDGEITNTPLSDIPPEQIESISVLKGEMAVLKYGEKAREGAIEITMRKEAGDDGSGEVFVVVEEMPQFPGGEEEMLLWVARNVKYPAQAVEERITGMVLVSFVVDKTGKVGNVKIKRGVHPSLDAEAARVVRSDARLEARHPER